MSGGFVHPDGRQAYLFSSDHPGVVKALRMRDYGIDGAWLQQFAVNLPGGLEDRHPSRAECVSTCGPPRLLRPRVGVCFDIAGMDAGLTYGVDAWRQLVDEGAAAVGSTRAASCRADLGLLPREHDQPWSPPSATD